MILMAEIQMYLKEQKPDVVHFCLRTPMDEKVLLGWMCKKNTGQFFCNNKGLTMGQLFKVILYMVKVKVSVFFRPPVVVLKSG
jgi:hypothetical protein